MGTSACISALLLLGCDADAIDAQVSPLGEGGEGATQEASAVFAMGETPKTAALGGPFGTDSVTVNGQVAGDYAGYAMTDVGDFNGDGYSDFVVGAYRAEFSSTNPSSGEAYLVTGGPWLANLTAPLDLNWIDPHIVGIFGTNASDYLGRSVSGVGDVNGDGFDDFVVGAQGADDAASGAGSAYIVLGNDSYGWGLFASSIRAGVRGVALDGDAASDYAGYSVGGAGDFNGDGLDDVIVAAPYADPGGKSGAGRVYIVFGQSSWGPSGNAVVSLGTLAATGLGVEIAGEFAGGYLGYSVAGAGDFNADGFADVVLGAYRAPSLTGVSYAGRVRVVLGQPSAGVIDLSNPSPGVFTVGGDAAYDYLGYSVAGGGDFNRDGFSDVVVGAPYVDTPGGSNVGAATVVFGRDVAGESVEASKLAPNGQGVVFHGEQPSDYFGRSVALGGDFNDDGLADVAFGADGADPSGSFSGRAYVAYGADDPAISSQPVLAVDLALGVGGTALDGEIASDRAGRDVAMMGAITGDLGPMLGVGAYRASPNGSSSGRAYVVLPKLESYYALNRAPIPLDDTVYADQGQSLSEPAPGLLANDVDHDGDSISVVPGQYVTAEGCVIDLFADGSFDVSPPTPTWWGTCTLPYTAEDGSGGERDATLSVVYALSDLSVDDLITANAGQIYNGEALGDGAAQSVDVLDDVNGDGRDELLLGAYGADYAAAWAGRVYVVHGRSQAAEVELSSVVSGAGGAALDGESPFDWLGLSVAAVDARKDGTSNDLLLSAIGHDAQGERTGRVYEISASGLGAGSPWGVEQAALNVFDGEEALGDAGRALGNVGDFDADGHPEVAIASYREDSMAVDMDGFPVADDVGAIYILFSWYLGWTNGGVFPLSGFPGLRIEGASEGDLAGFSISSAGDVNGDGWQDTIIGAYAADSENGEDAGRAYLLFGTGTLPSELELADVEAGIGGHGVVLDGGQPYELAGRFVAGVGDVNQDGWDDILIGAPGADDGTGCAYLVFGAADFGGPTAQVALADIIADARGIILHGAQVGDGLGSSGGTLGDFNGDGAPDFVVGAPFADSSTAAGAGQVFVVLGGDDLVSQYLPTADISAVGFGFAVSGSEAGDAFGHALAGGKDINGDGFDDLVVGAYEATPAAMRDSAGRAYVVFGHDETVGEGEPQ